MSLGRASRFAFDPAVVVAFLDHHSKADIGGHPRRMRLTINGHSVNRNNEARIIRRWRNSAQGLTMQGVARVLLHFGLSVPEMQRWAAQRGINPVLRGKLPTPPAKPNTRRSTAT